MNFSIPVLSNMSPREKNLTGAILILLLAMGGYRGYAAYREKADYYRAEQLSAEQHLNESRLAVVDGQRARHQLAQWRRASLPSNHNIARSLYRDWLREELNKASVQIKELRDVSAGELQTRSNSSAGYRSFTFSLFAQATLKDFTHFLSEFYSAPHLHRIAYASLKPTTDRQKLNISLTFEAIAIPGCQRIDQLATRKSSPATAPHQMATLSEELKTIQNRNLFVAYQKQTKLEQPTEKSAPPAADAAEQTSVSGMTLGGGGWRLALHRKDTGKVLYFRVGNRVHIGNFDGTISSMNGRQVVFHTSTEERTVRLGQSLSGK